MDNYIYFLFVTELVLIVVSFFISNGNLLSPSFLSYVMFAVATLFVIYNVEYWDVHYTLRAWIVTSLGFISMLMPEIIVIVCCKNTPVYAATHRKEQCDVLEIDSKINRLIIAISIVAIFTYAILIMRRGQRLGGVGLNAIGMAKYNEYSKSGLESLLYRFLMILFYVYLYMIVNNVVLCQKKIEKYLSYLLPIVFYFIAVFFAGNRIGILKLVLSVYAGVVAMLYKRKGTNAVRLRKVSRYATVAGSSVLLFFYLLRSVTKINTSMAGRSFIDYITFYIGSPIYVFSKYLEKPRSVHPVNSLWGEQTLTSLWQNLGVNVNYDNYYTLLGGHSHLATNVYTWFQGPINDYGIIGMVIFTSLIYGIFDYVLYVGIMRKGRDISIIFMMYFIFVVVTSFYYCQTMWALSFMSVIYILIILIGVRILPKIRIV